MLPNERNVVLATSGLLIAAVGAFLPWARIGGRSRSGFSTADTFIGLSRGVLPDAIAWVGRWWYLPAFLAVVAWGLTFVAGRLATRIVGVLLIALAIAMWWVFVWAGNHWRVLDVSLVGPVVSSLGLILVAWCTSQRRESLLKR